MEKIYITKDLLSVLLAFSKHSEASNCVSNNIYGCLQYNQDYCVTTDGIKLLYLPTNINIIMDNAYYLLRSKILDFKFYDKYYKNCDVMLNSATNRMEAYINNQYIDDTSVNITYPDCSRVLNYYNFNLILDVQSNIRDKMQANIATISKTIKEYNCIQKIQKLSQYTSKDLKDAVILFNSYYDETANRTYIQAKVDLKHEELNQALSEELVILDYALPTNELQNFEAKYKYLQVLDCFNTLQKIDKTGSFSIMFDTREEITRTPIKMMLGNCAYTLLMPCIR